MATQRGLPLAANGHFRGRSHVWKVPRQGAARGEGPQGGTLGRASHAQWTRREEGTAWFGVEEDQGQAQLPIGRRVHVLHKVAVVALFAALLAPASASASASAPRVLTVSELRVPVVFKRSIPVRLPQPVTVDISSDGVAAPPDVAVISPEGADLSRFEQPIGVALVEQGRTSGAAVVAAFDREGRVLLTYGQRGRRTVGRPLDEALSCTRCDLPAGDYDLFVFGGPFSRRQSDPPLTARIRFEGLPPGVEEFTGDEGRPTFILAGSAFNTGSSDTAGGGVDLAVIPSYDGVRRDGMHITQSTFTTKAAGALSPFSMTVEATVSNRPSIAGPVPNPMADVYGAHADLSDRPKTVRTSFVSALDGDLPYTYVRADGSMVGAESWRVVVTSIWLSTQAPAGPQDIGPQATTLHGHAYDRLVRAGSAGPWRAGAGEPAA